MTSLLQSDGVLPMRSYALDHARAEVVELPFTEPAHMAQRFHGRGLDARELTQRGVMQNHEGGDAALGRDLTPQLAQTLEQPLIHVAPRSLFDARPCRLCLRLHQGHG